MGVRWLVTDRTTGGGDPTTTYAGNLATHVGDDPADVAARRAGLATALGLAPAALVWMEQVHGREVAVVDGPRAAAVPAVDALVTATPGLGLAVLVADCRPVILTDEHEGVVAAVHAGRTGMQRDVVTAVLGAMRELGAKDVRAHVGPGVCAACYPVPAQLRADVAADVPAAHAVSADGGPALDLLAGITAQLRAAGVEDPDVDTRCTATDPGLPSYRRDGVTGRFAAVVVLDA